MDSRALSSSVENSALVVRRIDQTQQIASLWVVMASIAVSVAYRTLLWIHRSVTRRDGSQRGALEDSMAKVTSWPLGD
jgi:phosphate/sulfate permease